MSFEFFRQRGQEAPLHHEEEHWPSPEDYLGFHYDITPLIIERAEQEAATKKPGDRVEVQLHSTLPDQDIPVIPKELGTNLQMEVGKHGLLLLEVNRRSVLFQVCGGGESQAL